MAVLKTWNGTQWVVATGAEDLTGLSNIVEDLTPQLGGDLDVNGKEIQSAANIPFQLGDAAGVNAVQVQDSGGVQVASINSDGALVLASGATLTAGNLVLTLGNLTLTNGILAFTEGHAHFGTETANTSSSGVLTLDWTVGNKQKLTLSEDVTTLNFTNPGGVSSLTVRVIQDSTARTIAWTDIPVIWTDAEGEPDLSTISKVYFITLYTDGTTYWGFKTPPHAAS